MVEYYILIKKKNQKWFEGAIRVKKGVSLSQLRTLAKQVSPKYKIKIIVKAQLDILRKRIKASKTQKARRIVRKKKRVLKPKRKVTRRKKKR